MKKSGLTYGLTSLELFFWGPALCQSLSAGQNCEGWRGSRAQGWGLPAAAYRGRFLIGLGLASPSGC